MKIAAVFLIVALAAWSQQFEVATLKRSPPPDGNFQIDLGHALNGRVTLGNAALSDCLKFPTA